MKRRDFLRGLAVTTAAGLILPYEPKRIYSFPSTEFLQRSKIESFFDGLIDDVALWDRILTPHEVEQLFQHGPSFVDCPVAGLRMELVA